MNMISFAHAEMDVWNGTLVSYTREFKHPANVLQKEKDAARDDIYKYIYVVISVFMESFLFF